MQIFCQHLKIQEGKKLVFNIFIANKMIDKNKEWRKIGTVSLFKSVVSASCDQRLHFYHPKWRDNLNYGDKD